MDRKELIDTVAALHAKEYHQIPLFRMVIDRIIFSPEDDPTKILLEGLAVLSKIHEEQTIEIRRLKEKIPSDPIVQSESGDYFGW